MPMTVKLIKKHKQNGLEHQPGETIRVPFELGSAMCNTGSAIYMPTLTAGVIRAQKAANAAKEADKAKAAGGATQHARDRK